MTAHPRSRGEHTCFTRNFFDSGGSSPLARGTRFSGSSIVRAYRLIPARAGNTTARRASGRLDAAHPRSRGEHWIMPSRPSLSAGSSPLARGTLLVHPPHRVTARLIPARAGNTSRSPSGSLARPAHPRSRGEHEFNTEGMLRGDGSSPLARGTR